jgi:hypothetical protein
MANSFFIYGRVPIGVEKRALPGIVWVTPSSEAGYRKAQPVCRAWPGSTDAGPLGPGPG